MRYTTWGPKAGCCQHVHDTEGAAWACIERRGARVGRHRNDRKVRIVDDNADLSGPGPIGKALPPRPHEECFATPEECERGFLAMDWLDDIRPIG